MKHVLVTGGGGFVGSALVARLREMGCFVTIAARNRYPSIESLGVRGAVGDLADPVFAREICAGQDTVFHTAAKAGIWGTWESYRRTNVDGTRNLIAACQKQGVRTMVYTSTPSVVFNRSDIRSGDEKLPYPGSFLCHYARSKAIAEQEVLHADDHRLRTCAIRPHLIWGPGDPHLIPRLVKRGKAQELKIVGDGSNQVDITYIDNVVHAHICAAQALEANERARGQAYFIGQERPVRLWDWVNELFVQLDIKPVTKKITFPVAYVAGAMLETGYRLLGVQREPKMTRFLAQQLARSHYFSHAKAEKDLGYHPIVTLEEGQRQLLSWLRTL